MKGLHLQPVTKGSDPKQNKQAIDGIYRALTPDYLAILAQLKERLRLSDAERAKLGEIGHRLGRKALGEVATTALPDTILAWYRRLVESPRRGGDYRSAGHHLSVVPKARRSQI